LEDLSIYVEFGSIGVENWTIAVIPLAEKFGSRTKYGKIIIHISETHHGTACQDQKVTSLKDHNSRRAE